MRRLILLTESVLVAIVFLAGSSGETPQHHPGYIAVLDARLELQSGESRDAINRLFDGLHELSEAKTDANQALVDLLDYYLGAGPGEILTDIITTRGQEIAPLLRNKRDEQLKCLPKYKSICADSVQHRNSQIGEMLEAIDAGIILEAAD